MRVNIDRYWIVSNREKVDTGDIFILEPEQQYDGKLERKLALEKR